MARIPQPVVLYMDQATLDAGSEAPKGAACGKCIMFAADVSECVILRPPHVDGPQGVCGLFVGGPVTSSMERPSIQVVPAEAAGYTEDGPTRCGNCRNFLAPQHCAVVAGQVEANGCCNGWKGRGH